MEDSEWFDIGQRHIFADFKSMACHIYYRLGGSINDLLINVQATHPKVTREMIVAKFAEMDLPLRKSEP